MDGLKNGITPFSPVDYNIIGIMRIKGKEKMGGTKHFEKYFS